jgi:hypothetical protein
MSRSRPRATNRTKSAPISIRSACTSPAGSIVQTFRIYATLAGLLTGGRALWSETSRLESRFIRFGRHGWPSMAATCRTSARRGARACSSQPNTVASRSRSLICGSAPLHSSNATISVWPWIVAVWSGVAVQWLPGVRVDVDAGTKQQPHDLGLAAHAGEHRALLGRYPSVGGQREIFRVIWCRDRPLTNRHGGAFALMPTWPSPGELRPCCSAVGPSYAQPRG